MAEIIKGCGVDLIEIERIARALKKPGFIQRVYTEAEQESLVHRGSQSWAGRFAAKEAVMKALGCGWQRGVGFRDIEITSDPWGKPLVALVGKAKEIASQQQITGIHLSLAHNRNSAIAYALAVGRK